MTVAFGSGLQSNLRFVLIAYADHADHEGGNIYPSVAQVMEKTGYSRRTVQVLTRKLEELGWLLPDGAGPRGVNRYRLGTGLDRSAEAEGGREDCAGAKIARAQSTTGGGRNPRQGGAQPTAPESSVEPTPEPSVGEPARATPTSTPAEMRRERDAHLASLELRAPGFGEAFAGWRVALPRHKAWTLWSEVLKLRMFVGLSGRYSGADLLEMAQLGAERQWQGFEERWFLQERRAVQTGRRSSSPRPARPGFNAADADDLDAVVIRQGGPRG